MFIARFTGALHRGGARRLAARPIATLAIALVAAVPLRAQHPAPAEPAAKPAPSATAAPAPAFAPITLDQAIQIALQQNGTLRQAKNSASLGATAVKQQQLAFLPNLAASLSTSQNYSTGGLAAVTATGLPESNALNQSSQSVSAGVSSSVTLFNGLKNVDQLRSAKLLQQAGTQDVTRAQQTVIYTVAANYINLADQQEQLRVQQQNLASQQAQEKEIQAGVNAGTHPISDLYQQQALVAGAQASVVDAQNAVALAKVTLMQTLQLDPRGSYEFATPPVDTTTSADTSLDLDSLLTRALSQRADIAAQQSRAGAAKQDVSAASASWWPTISLTAGYSTAYNSAAVASLADQLGQRQGATVGIGISIPIFDRGATAVATQQAKIAADNASIVLQTQQQQVGADVRSAYLDYQAAQQRLTAANAQLTAATQAVNAAEQRYRVGAGTLVDLTQARATLVQAQSAQVSARYDLVLQRAAMSYAVGDLSAQHALG
ncbi:MAG TPA: TolC family protein [Gemmatimonadaceae bacterium]|nr:TolC family protein [Gemmatimonadaceae bacterium]